MKAFVAVKAGKCDDCGCIWWPGENRFELMGKDLCGDCAEGDWDRGVDGAKGTLQAGPG